jgi:hypothetical protein
MLLMVWQLETLEKTRYVRKHESYSMTYFRELLVNKKKLMFWQFHVWNWIIKLINTLTLVLYIVSINILFNITIAFTTTISHILPFVTIFLWLSEISNNWIFLPEINNYVSIDGLWCFCNAFSHAILAFILGKLGNKALTSKQRLNNILMDTIYRTSVNVYD